MVTLREAMDIHDLMITLFGLAIIICLLPSSLFVNTTLDLAFPTSETDCRVVIPPSATCRSD